MINKISRHSLAVVVVVVVVAVAVVVVAVVVVVVVVVNVVVNVVVVVVIFLFFFFFWWWWSLLRLLSVAVTGLHIPGFTRLCFLYHCESDSPLGLHHFFINYKNSKHYQTGA